MPRRSQKRKKKERKKGRKKDEVTLKAGEVWGFDDKEKTRAYIKAHDDFEASVKKKIDNHMKNILPAWKEKRIVDGSIDSRKAKGTAACLAFINKYNDEQAWEIYSALTLNKNKLTKGKAKDQR